MVGLVMTAKHLRLGREEFRAWAHLLLGRAEGEKFTEEDYRTLEEQTKEETEALLDLVVTSNEVGAWEWD